MASIEQELPKPEWATLDDPAAFNMAPGSIGHGLLAKYHNLLRERRRPVTIFDQRPLSLQSQGLWKEAEKRGLSTVGELLHLPEDELAPPTFSHSFVKGLHDYVEGLAIPPHARLVYAVLGQEHHFTPFPPALEQEFIQTVEDQLGRLTARERDVLIYRNGLADGVTRRRDQIAAHPAFNRSTERIRQIEAKALLKLRHPSRSRSLGMFIPFPEGSLGRAVFGPRLRRYLPPMHKVQLPDSVREELTRYGGYGLSFQSLTTVLEWQATPLQLENIHQIALWLDHGLNNPQIQAPSPDIREQKQWTNNLLPELPITSEQLTAIGRLDLSEVGFPNEIWIMFKKNFVRTFGDVLAMTPLEFAGIRRLGKTGIRRLGKMRAFQFGMKLGELLQLPQDQYPNDYVAKLLENIIINLKATAVRASRSF